MRKIISIILAIAMITALFTFGSPASAEESYTVLFENEEVTDIDQLLQMYEWSQRASQRPTTGYSSRSLIDEERIIIPQTLECREYADGRIVYDMSATEIVAYEENGVALTAAGTYGSYSSSGGLGTVGVTLTSNFYYYVDGGVYAEITSVSAKLVNKLSADTVNFCLMFLVQDHMTGQQWDRTKIVSNVAVGTTHTLANSTGSYPVPLDKPNSRACSGVFVGINKKIVVDANKELAKDEVYFTNLPSIEHNTSLFKSWIETRV